MNALPDPIGDRPRAAAAAPPVGFTGESRLATDVLDELGRVIVGQRTLLERLLIGLLADGHVLLEGVPGLAKTLAVRTLAATVSGGFHRIQFTPDLLPADLIGTQIYNQRSGEFTVQKGPIFTNILLADEINRASPRTQSALLEAMGEGQVSVDGQRRDLADLFFVIATENPVEFRGTYPLPEAQMDRFAMQFALGYVQPTEEVAILTAQAHSHPLDDLQPCASLADVLALKRAAHQVRISDELKRYAVDLVRATRSAAGVQLGASPRASISLMKAAQALALFDALDFVTPEHIQELAVSVIAHRLVMEPQARFSGLTVRGVVEETVKKFKVPA